MDKVKLTVLYPWPENVEEFDEDYSRHIHLMQAILQLPRDRTPFQVTRFAETPLGKPLYYLMFSMGFPSREALLQTVTSREMQEVAADAVRISSGGTPVILVGSDSW